MVVLGERGASYERGTPVAPRKRQLQQRIFDTTISRGNGGGSEWGEAKIAPSMYQVTNFLNVIQSIATDRSGRKNGRVSLQGYLAHTKTPPPGTLQ